MKENLPTAWLAFGVICPTFFISIDGQTWALGKAGIVVVVGFFMMFFFFVAEEAREETTPAAANSRGLPKKSRRDRPAFLAKEAQYKTQQG